MMNESPRLGQGTESTPAHLEYVPAPQHFETIKGQLMAMVAISGRSVQNGNLCLEGFNDILPDSLGSGTDTNTFGTILQLAFALSISPVAEQLAHTNSSERPKDVIQRWRKQNILSGMRIIDLGSGHLPSFAIAAHSLGAQTYTVDAEDVDPEVKGKISGHVRVNLSIDGISNILEKVTGGNFDLMTEHIIDIKGARAILMDVPKGQQIMNIARALLKMGGYLYSDQVESFQTGNKLQPLPLKRTR